MFSGFKAPSTMTPAPIYGHAGLPGAILSILVIAGLLSLTKLLPQTLQNPLTLLCLLLGLHASRNPSSRPRVLKLLALSLLLLHVPTSLHPAPVTKRLLANRLLRAATCGAALYLLAQAAAFAIWLGIVFTVAVVLASTLLPSVCPAPGKRGTPSAVALGGDLLAGHRPGVATLLAGLPATGVHALTALALAQGSDAIPGAHGAALLAATGAAGLALATHVVPALAGGGGAGEAAMWAGGGVAGAVLVAVERERGAAWPAVGVVWAFRLALMGLEAVECGAGARERGRERVVAAARVGAGACLAGAAAWRLGVAGMGERAPA